MKGRGQGKTSTESN